MYITKVGFYFILSIVLVCLVGCQKKVTQEIVEDEYVSIVYKNFVIYPQGEQERLFKHQGQGLYGLLKTILMSKEIPTEKTLKAFSQLFAEAYRNALNENLSESENENHAQILGTIIGGLMGLREQVLAKRKSRWLAGWYDYTEIDKRWLALLTDIVLLHASHILPKEGIRIAHTGDVNEFSEFMIRSPYAQNIEKEEDLIIKLLDKIVDLTIPKFNRYAKATERSLGSVFGIARVVAWDDIKSLTD